MEIKTSTLVKSDSEDVKLAKAYIELMRQYLCYGVICLEKLTAIGDYLSEYLASFETSTIDCYTTERTVKASPRGVTAYNEGMALLKAELTNTKNIKPTTTSKGIKLKLID